jgi:aspartate carbamoyltransferase catalytic subunit
MPASVTPASRSLLGLEGLPAEALRELLNAAHEMGQRPPRATLAGRIVVNLFFEDSTRTRMSFSIAARRLGAEVVDLLGSGSSVSKGETLIDTARNVEAMGVAAIVVRARQSGAAAMIARHVSCPVINAGDGRHEHPTQGLLDIYTLAESHGRLGSFDLRGLRVAIVGDAAASRVARSAIAGMTTLGAEVVCVGPPALAPRSLSALGATVSHELDAVLPRVDAVMMLRIQFERYGEGKGAEQQRSAPIHSIREYRELYALTPERTRMMKPGAIVMHPGPINRGIEMDGAVADGERSVVLRQVHNGVLVRMAVLERAVL